MGVWTLTDEDGRNYVYGLRDMKTKSAADTMEAFIDIRHDVDARLAGKTDIDSTKMSPGTQLLLTIDSTMSDNAGTEILFNSNVEKLLNETKAAYSNAEEEEADLGVKLLNLF